MLEVLENREKETVLAYLRREKEAGLLAHVVEVTTDMWVAYVEAAREVFGSGVRIVIDRFHVMKLFQEYLEKERRAIQRALPAEAAKALKGLRWLWITNPENLTADQREELAEVKRLFPELRRLHDLRESLRAIFDDRRVTTAATGANKLREWIGSALKLGSKALSKFCETLERWLDPIANYFIGRASNGPTEGFNRGLRGILWRACGMFNFQHFRLRVLDRFGRPQPQPSP